MWNKGFMKIKLYQDYEIFFINPKMFSISEQNVSENDQNRSLSQKSLHNSN